MPRILVDGRRYDVEPGRNVLQACLEAGLDLPYFCWHPALGSVGSCRQCAVKQFEDEDDERGKLVMACMTPARDGARVSIEDGEARRFRASVVEWLMLNHPHDCPVCDEGGECHLQDMTVMTGHAVRRTRFPKRTFRSQDLGPLIHHEMNRCIECYRCVRFYKDHAGGRDLDVFAAHDHVYFGRAEDGPLESPFSGNLVEVCPTGVFTDRTLRRHYARKWDMETAPSVCPHCALGCNTLPGAREGTLRRVRNRYHSEVNGYFLCDRGRFGYEFANGPERLRTARSRSAGGEAAEPVPAGVAVSRAATALSDGGRVLGIGSPRATLEANAALRRLVGDDAFHLGLAAKEHACVGRILEEMRAGPARAPSLKDVERADAVLVLGEDVTGAAPRMALALRQSVWQQPLGELAGRDDVPLWHDAAVREVVQERRGPLFVATAHATDLDDVARETCRAAPDDLARLGFAVAHAVDDARPGVPGLDAGTRALAGRIAEALGRAQRPLVVSGVSCGESVVEAAAAAARALCTRGRPASVAWALPECDTLGLALLGGRPLAEALERAERGEVEAVVVLENDLYRRAPKARVDALLDRARCTVVIDTLETATARRADVVLPAAAFAESDGTWLSSEGRAQRFHRVLPAEDVEPAWAWLREIEAAIGADAAPGSARRLDGWTGLADAARDLADRHPELADLPRLAARHGAPEDGRRWPREPHRYSGRTALEADRQVDVPPPPPDRRSPFTFSMEGRREPPPGPLVNRYWAPGWNSVQALNRFQEEIGGALSGGEGGVRLARPEGHPLPRVADPPEAFAPRPGRLLVIPIPAVFGGEELSRLAPGVAERTPPATLSIPPCASEAHGLGAGDTATLELAGARLRLPVRIDASLPEGVAGLRVGPAETAAADLPQWGALVEEGA